MLFKSQSKQTIKHKSTKTNKLNKLNLANGIIFYSVPRTPDIVVHKQEMFFFYLAARGVTNGCAESNL